MLAFEDEQEQPEPDDADEFGEEGRIGQEGGQADGLEVLSRTGKGEGHPLQHEAVGDEHDAQGNPEKQGAVGGRGRFVPGHPKSPCICMHIHMHLHRNVKHDAIA